MKRYLQTIQITQDIKNTVKIRYNPIIQLKPPLNFWYINLNVRLSLFNVIEHLFYLIMPPVQILYWWSNFMIQFAYRKRMFFMWKQVFWLHWWVCLQSCKLRNWFFWRLFTSYYMSALVNALVIYFYTWLIISLSTVIFGHRSYSEFSHGPEVWFVPMEKNLTEDW